MLQKEISMISDIVQIRRTGPISIQTQIAEGFARAIFEGTLKDGHRLPSLRALSLQLGISAATAAAAYRNLIARRLVAAHPRSGFIVSTVTGAKTAEGATEFLALHRIEPNLRIHPGADFARILADVAAFDKEAGGYEDYRGSRRLRDRLAEFDREDGIATDPGTELLVTSGAQQAITIIARTVGPGARIAVEDPTYPGARLAFASAGTELVPVVATENGPEEASLEKVCESGRIDLFYCCPTYGNPSGRSWDGEARSRVLRASARYGFTIIEDDYLGDLDYLDERLPRLAALASAFPGARVIRVRTFSKCLLPALRVAGVSADEHTISRLLATKSADDICGSALIQRGLARYLELGLYAEHLKSVRPHYSALRSALRKALARAGSGLQFDDPPAGLCLLGSLEQGMDLSRFIAECRSEGVLVSPGPDYWQDGSRGALKFRIGFGGLELADIPRAVDAMKRAATHSRNDFFERALI
jgi:GntR family transcriptional regulator/MocR family aminotransferase